MVNIDTIEKEILSLEAKDTTYAVIERLALLYIVRDHLKAPTDEMTGDIDGGAFCKACSNVPISQLVAILSEHMEAVGLLYPREYDAIMQKIEDLN